MRRGDVGVFREVAWKQNRPLAELLNAQVTFATRRLAEHYGLKPVGNKLSRYDLAAVPGRGGLLTQGSVLTIGGDDASMVARGLFVLHDLLRGTVNAPPPCVNTTPPPTKTGLTQRGIAEIRIADQNCGVCHARFEPLAFGLEKFDGIGSMREKDEHGNKLRDDGEILFPGEAKPVKYQSSAELMNLLADSNRVQTSLTWKITQFALGRPLVASDASAVDEIHKSAQQGGGTYTSTIRDCVKRSRSENQNGKDPMTKQTLPRRTMLKGLGTATIGLPFLEEMLASSTSVAAGAEKAVVPVRAFNVFFGLGIPAPLQTEGFSGVMEPLKPLGDKLLIMRGVDHVRADEKGINAHYDGAAAAFTAETTAGRSQSGWCVDRPNDSPLLLPSGIAGRDGPDARWRNFFPPQSCLPVCPQLQPGRYRCRDDARNAARSFRTCLWHCSTSGRRP